MARPAFQWPKMDDGSALSDVIDALNRRLVGLGFTIKALLGYLDQVQDEALKALTWNFAWGDVTTTTPDVSQAIVQRVTSPVAITSLVRPAGESVSFIILVAMGAGVSIVNSASLRTISGANVTLASGEARLFAAVNVSGGAAVWQEVGPTTIAVPGTITSGSNILAGSGNVVGWSGRGFLEATSDGNLEAFASNATTRASLTLLGLTLVGLGSGGGVVGVGAADSAGSGFRALRVPN